MRCQAGDMAIITGGSSIGSLVEVLRWIGTPKYSKVPNCWEVRLLSGANVKRYYADGRTEFRRLAAGSISKCRDSYLTPLKGDPDAIDEHTEAPTKIKEPA